MNLAVIPDRSANDVDCIECCFSSGKTLLLTTTLSCNQNCLHCMRDARIGAASSLDLQILAPRLTQAIRRIQPERLVISGGEPTLIQNLDQLVELVRGLGVKIGICTNAIAIDAALAFRLASAGLDGATVGMEDIWDGYDRFRGSPGGFQRMIRGIEHLSKAGVSVTLNITVHGGVQANAIDIAQTIGRLPIKTVTVTSPIAHGRAATSAFIRGGASLPAIKEFCRLLSENLDIPVSIRVPRCASLTCPSGVSIFSINEHGELTGCPDVGAENLCDISIHNRYRL